MQTVIYKYDVLPSFSLLLPAGANVLTVQIQDDTPKVWVAQSRAAGVEVGERHFRCYGTGHPFDLEGKRYIGTFQQQEFVWHLFEVVNA